MTKTTHTLFEISFEACNKVGGIYTVLSTKARTLTTEFGDDYVLVGPWMVHDDAREIPFEEDPGFADFAESCRSMGVPVRVGRWTVPGRPRTILVDFSRLYDGKDDVLSELWENWSVDSIEGGWDYVEPVLFGWATGRVIERYWETYLAPVRRRAVAQFHEWMTGSGLLYLKERLPSVGTIFTTHATMLGRALSSLGNSPEEGLGNETPAELAAVHGVSAKHSLEGVSAREADVFTTVSEITAREAELLHGRVPEPLLPNGVDLDVIDELVGPVGREQMRAELVRLASRFLGEDASGAALLTTSGRYEFHNKGLDLLLDSLALMDARPGRQIVLFVFVPAGNSGVRPEVRERLSEDAPEPVGPIGIATHNLFDVDGDEIASHCEHLGLANATGSRVKVIHVPIYLESGDGLLGEPYEAVVRATDLTVFPSYYEPWGYTPQESLALGVPTITTDYAGFGRWAQGEGLEPEHGVTVLARARRRYVEVVDDLAGVLEESLAGGPPVADLAGVCTESAARTSWSSFIENYRTAFQRALEAVQGRLERGVPQARRVKRTVDVVPGSEGGRPRLLPFEVVTTLPEPLARLRDLARNFWWTWDPEARDVFQRLSPEAWEACAHSPIRFLRRVDSVDLDVAAADDEFLGRFWAALARFDAYMAEDREPALDLPAISRDAPVAYFCAEYGIHESFPIYSGGLGILAGDHLKSASDMRLPLVAVGLFYRGGYMVQSVSSDGEQHVSEIENDPRDLPLEPVLDERGAPLELRISWPGHEIAVRAWRASVGTVPVYLLDTDVPSNQEQDRRITRRLYGGDETTRIQQEIVLGRGGVRLLRQLGIEPSAWHMNEGHAAFLALERVAQMVRHEGLTFHEAREVVRATTAFTTHTPVPAGHDRFSEDLMRRYFADVEEWVGLPWERFFALGTVDGTGSFNMTYLALSFASYANGVSRVHGLASKRLLHPFWPGLLESEVPVAAITNGVHLATWTCPSLGRLLGANERPVDGRDFATAAESLDQGELWAERRSAKGRLVELLRESLKASFVERDDSPVLLQRMLDGMDEDALWVGFARRFAPYKRAHLLFADHERLRALLTGEDRPMKLVIAGKAHPKDQRGQEILRDIVKLTRSDEFAGSIFFVEGYDIELGRALVQGVDVWLNTPTRMEEASGTSGMKAAANGVLNLSIGDGWWPEAADGRNGWTIADGRVYEEQDRQDQHDSTTLYRLLEEELLPLFFERDGDGLPVGWLERVRHALATIPPVFDSGRMVGEYAANAYGPLAVCARELSADRRAGARSRAAEGHRIRRGFGSLEVGRVEIGDLASLRVGDAIESRVEVALGELTVDDVVVELVLGQAQGERDLSGAHCVPLVAKGADEGGSQVFEGRYLLEHPGDYAYGIRIRAASEGARGGPSEGRVRWL